MRHAIRAAVVVLAAGCADGSTGPRNDAALAFATETLELGATRSGTIVVRNAGSGAVGPIEIVGSPVVKAGIELPGVQVVSTPEEIATLNPGDSALVHVEIAGSDDLQSGHYAARLQARVENAAVASASLHFDVVEAAARVASVTITQAPDSLRQGDVAQFSAAVYDSTGAPVEDVTVSWSSTLGAGLFTASGLFIPYAVGPVAIIASVGGKADTLMYAVEPRGRSGSFTVAGHGAVMSRFTSDVWVHGGAAITGTWGFREQSGDMVYAWDVSGPAPVLSDSIRVQAFTVDDVMIRADGQLAVVTHEYMPTQHAITLVDMTDPLHPTVAGEYHSDFNEAWIGVHNAWLDGDYAYIVVDGTAENRGLWILDVSDPQNPMRVGRFYAGRSFLHDVIVRDGLAFLSHWDAGLVILDVGNGIRGGSPAHPVEVSRIVTSGAQVHNAWYWPEAGYVFIGEEDFSTPGRLHVVDVSDLAHPVEVASFRMPGDTPHNYWLDEENAVLYTSWYSRGVQAIDVSGRLVGSLDLQGRLIAHLEYQGSSAENCPGFGLDPSTCAWGPQLHDGFLYVADMNTGLWKLQPSF
jgi:hypothetical protein